MTDADYEHVVEKLLAERAPGPFWLFVYGSLIWKPEVEHVEERLAKAPGWHRAFCLKLVRWRGTPETPGLMMALDRGGSCNGLIYRLAEESVREQFGKLLRREMSIKWLPQDFSLTANIPRWIKVKSGGETIPALAFVANPRGRAYAGNLSLEQVAHMLATAAGHWGSCAEYLHNTIVHLDRRGIRDSGLWHLQELVAAEIEMMRPANSR